MQSPQPHTLHTVCKRYGFGRLPNADQQDVSAGCVAATAALVATVQYGTAISIGAVLGMGLEGAVNLSAAMFAAGLVAVAFVLTWWVTIPVGCLSRFVYVNAIECAN